MKTPSRKTRAAESTPDSREVASGKEVFVSVGHGLTPDEEAFVQRVKAFLARKDIHAVVIERQTQMIRDPIGRIRSAIGHADGTLVIAIERFRAEDMVEFPRSPHAIACGAARLPTVWNQIEAAMALQAGLPLLILVEERITSQGIIDPTIHPVTPFSLRPADGELPQPVLDALDQWIRTL